MFGLDRALGLGGPSGGLSKNEAFHVLSNQRRRYALHYLQQRDGQAELSDLAEQVAAWENDTSVSAVDSDVRKSVYISLHQSHLPKMDEIGVVEYDRDRNTVSLADNAAQLAIHLEVVPERHLPWSEVYLGLSAVAAALVAALWVDTYPFVLVGDLTWATLIVAAFAFTAAINVYTSRQVRLGDEGPPAELVEGD